jgi:chromosome segregation ATPase
MESKPGSQEVPGTDRMKDYPPMDNGEKPIAWEQEASTYQNALEIALEYQHQLEQTICKLKEQIDLQQSTISFQNIGHTQQTETISKLRAELTQRSNSVLELQRKNNKLFKENRQYKSAYQEMEEDSERLAEKLKDLQFSSEQHAQKIKEQAEQIAQLEQTIQLQQRLLRNQRES